MSELTGAERVVLIDLVAQMVLADDDTSFEEMRELEALAEEMGQDEFDRALGVARTRTREEVLEEAATVTRPEARDLIRTVLHDVAAADGIVYQEAALIVDLVMLWR